MAIFVRVHGAWGGAHGSRKDATGRAGNDYRGGRPPGATGKPPPIT